MNAWLTPSDTPARYEWRAFPLPITTPEIEAAYEAILRGLITALIDVNNFEQLEGISTDDTVLAFEPLVEAVLGGIMAFPIGSCVAWAGISPPVGWLACDGSEVLQSAYPYLYATIGNTFGAATSGYFRLPDMQDRAPIGGGDNYVLGDSGGNKEHTLTLNEIPSHGHTIFALGLAQRGAGTAGLTYVFNPATSGATNNSGGGLAHNNMPPYLALNYIIFTGQ